MRAQRALPADGHRVGVETAHDRAGRAALQNLGAGCQPPSGGVTAMSPCEAGASDVADSSKNDGPAMRASHASPCQASARHSVHKNAQQAATATASRTPTAAIASALRVEDDVSNAVLPATLVAAIQSKLATLVRLYGAAWCAARSAKPARHVLPSPALGPSLPSSLLPLPPPPPPSLSLSLSSLPLPPQSSIAATSVQQRNVALLPECATPSAALCRRRTSAMEAGATPPLSPQSAWNPEADERLDPPLPRRFCSPFGPVGSDKIRCPAPSRSNMAV